MLVYILIYFVVKLFTIAMKNISEFSGIEIKNISQKELAILYYLRSNGRYTVTQIGKKVGIPRTTVFEKIKKFKRLRLIPRFTAIVDSSKLGQLNLSYVLFKTELAKKLELGEALAHSAYTNDVMKLGNEYDYLASFIFPDIEDLHNFLDIITQKYEVKEVKILYAAKDLKREGFMTLPTNNNCLDIETDIVEKSAEIV